MRLGWRLREMGRFSCPGCIATLDIVSSDGARPHFTLHGVVFAILVLTRFGRHNSLGLYYGMLTQHLGY
jgi:hypothetical protein